MDSSQPLLGRDDIPPEVLEQTPRPGDSGVDYSYVAIIFSEEMATQPLTAANFQVLAPESQIVPGALVYEPEKLRAIFIPRRAFLPKTRYRVRLSRALTDLALNPLRAARESGMAWEFTTGNSPAPPGFIPEIADGGPGDNTKPDTACGADVFEAIIEPLFTSRCMPCHGAANHSGMLVLEAGQIRSQTVLVPSSTSPFLRVAPGRPQESELFRRVAGLDDPARRMPRDGEPLTDEEIEAVRCWVLTE